MEEIKQEILNVRQELVDMRECILHPEWIDKVGKMIDELDTIVSRVELPVILQGELLPCPFCGEVPEIKYLPKPLVFKGASMIGYLRCCHINITVRGKRKRDMAKQITELWNKRAGREPKSE